MSRCVYVDAWIRELSGAGAARRLRLPAELQLRDRSAAIIERVVKWWSFLAVAVPLVLTPGASTAVVLRNSLSGGVRGGLETAVGANAGSVCFGLLCAGGFSLALARWPQVWVVLRVAGCLYLAWLGLQSLRRAIAASPLRPSSAAGCPCRRALRARRLHHQRVESSTRDVLFSRPAAVHRPWRVGRACGPAVDGGSHRARVLLARRLGGRGRDALARACLGVAAPRARSCGRPCPGRARIHDWSPDGAAALTVDW